MMWIFYALAASVIWGMSYAASGRVIERGVTPLTFFFCYAASSTLLAGMALFFLGGMSPVVAQVRGLGADTHWLVVAALTSGIGSLLIYMAIGEKNATLASLIEISYPLFVGIFAWVFFRETQFNTLTIMGGVLIIAGVAVVFAGNRG